MVGFMARDEKRQGNLTNPIICQETALFTTKRRGSNAKNLSTHMQYLDRTFVRRFT